MKKVKTSRGVLFSVINENEISWQEKLEGINYYHTIHRSNGVLSIFDTNSNRIVLYMNCEVKKQKF